MLLLLLLLLCASPFISSTRRNTPWAAGCWGPKLMVKLFTCGDRQQPTAHG